MGWGGKIEETGGGSHCDGLKDEIAARQIHTSLDATGKGKR